MDVFLANEQDVPLDDSRLIVLARHVLAAEEVDRLVVGDGTAQLSLLLVSPGHMRRLNHRYAGNDYATDVLSFPMMEEDDDSLLVGDVVICPAVAQRNARKYGHSLGHELDTLLVHGILHLLGWDHEVKEDEIKMDHRLKDILQSFEPSPA